MADPRSTGTGTEGAKPPAGTGTPVSTSPEKRIKKMADKAAQKGVQRQQRSKPTEFTK